MVDFDSEFLTYDVTTRLFRVVNNMSKDKQLILLKQLIRDEITNYLFKLIIDLSDDQQIRLLEQLDEMPVEDIPAKTISLDDDVSIRENPRKSCLIRADYVVEKRYFSSDIIDISTVGVFIETTDEFSAGQKIGMRFSLPNHKAALKLFGKIVWIGLQGIGVKFTQLDPSQEEIIKAFIENSRSAS